LSRECRFFCACASPLDWALPLTRERARCQARLIAKFDNLGKAASGAAVQNLMLMLGR